MGVIGPDGCGYVGRDGEVVKITNHDGTITNYGRANMIDTILEISVKYKYQKQFCLLFVGEDYERFLMTLTSQYHDLANLKIKKENLEYQKLKEEKSKLVKKLLRGFKLEFRETFQNDLEKLDSILINIISKE